MLFHIVFGQFDADGETLDDEDDAREFEGDLIRIAPCVRVDQVGGMGTEDDAADGSDGGFADVETFFDKGGAEHEEGGEAAKDNVDQMRSIDCETIPCHDEGWMSILGSYG